MSTQQTTLRRLKIKSPDPLGLPLFLDPKDLTERNARLRREKRILRSQQRQDAYQRNPGKYVAWQARIEKFYKRAIWGAPPPEGSQRSVSSRGKGNARTRQQELSLFSAEAMDRPVQLPSQTLWHYYYYNGKTRGERRALTLKRIENMRQRHKESLEERRRTHRARIKRFAKVGMERKQRALAKDSGLFTPVDAIEEASAKAEAAWRIQQFYRSKRPPSTRCEACLTTASIGSADAAVQTDEVLQELITIDQYLDEEEDQAVHKGMLEQSYPYEEERSEVANDSAEGLPSENEYSSNRPPSFSIEELPDAYGDGVASCVRQLMEVLLESIERQAEVVSGHELENNWIGTDGTYYYHHGAEDDPSYDINQTPDVEAQYAQGAEMAISDILNHIEWTLYQAECSTLDPLDYVTNE